MQRYQCGICGQYYNRAGRHWALRDDTGHRTFRCTNCRADAANARMRQHRTQSRAARPCAHCVVTFTPKRDDGRFCSNKCRQAAYRQRAASTNGE